MNSIISIAFYLLTFTNNVIVSNPSQLEVYAFSECDEGTEHLFNSSDISSILSDYVINSIWTKQSSKLLSDVNGGNPKSCYDSDRNFTSFQEAKVNNGYNYDDYVGCGYNALYCVLEYFAKYGHYDWLALDEYSNEDYVSLADYILNEAISFPFTYNNQRYVAISQSEMVRTLNTTLIHFGYNNVLKANYLPWNNYPNSQKFAMIIDSVDKGFPIIWQCNLNNSSMNSHYIVIYGYEIWSTTVNGDEQTYPMFKAYYNFSPEFDSYVHPNMFSYSNTAIFFSTVTNAYHFKDNEFITSCSYPFSEQTFSIDYENRNITGFYKRTGYVIDSDNNQFLTMSSRKANAGEAYLTINFPEKVNKLYCYISLWGSCEYFDLNNDYFKIYGRNSNSNDWVPLNGPELHLLTSDRFNQKYYFVNFLESYYQIMFKVMSSPIGDRNKGRVVLHNLSFFGENFINN